MLLLLLAACTDDGKPDTAADACTTDDVDLVEMLTHAIDGEADDCEVEALADWVSEKTEENGPWKQQIRVAHSDDARTFTALDGVVMDVAAVPEVVVDDDGKYWLFYVDGNFDKAVDLAEDGSTWMQTHGVPGLGALGCAVSEDGRTFEPVEEFEVEDVVRGMVVDPDVIHQPDGTWRMFYVGLPAEEYLTAATWQYPEAHEVYTAVSDDLVHWRQEGALFRGPYADPSVSCLEDGRCTMASFGLQWSRSEDGGRTWTHDGEWGTGGFAPEFVTFEDGSRRMFFNTRDLGAAIYSFYETPDGIWELELDERMPDTYGEAVTLARAQPSGWYMYFHTFRDLDDLPF